MTIVKSAYHPHVAVPVAGQKAKSALPETQIKVQSFSYTAFGEQMGRKVSGFGYNAEDFDAATGMINLRARQYEPNLNRFIQKDLIKGFIAIPLSNNLQGYAMNNPIMLRDPSGLTAEDDISIFDIMGEQNENNRTTTPDFQSQINNKGILNYDEVQMITTKEAYEINGGKPHQHIPGGGQLYDIQSGQTINIVWGNVPDKYHTDWSPAKESDLNIIKEILHPELSPSDPKWKDNKTWSWDARPAILIMQDGTKAAVGIHFKPHLSKVGGSQVTSLQSISRSKGTKPVGGHMCMYYGDSRHNVDKRADPNNKYNLAAQEALRLSKQNAVLQRKERFNQLSLTVNKVLNNIKTYAQSLLSSFLPPKTTHNEYSQ